jgi:adenosylcobyric acid synthase
VRAPCLMVQGTASGVGKSVLTVALCRLFSRAGHRVVPFKSQNMALNAAVTVDGSEIGRAQAVQAEAAGIEATADMNPILLKPESDERSQVVVLGRAVGRLTFAEYRAMTPWLLEVVRDSLDRLRRATDLVVIEGAGSPAEINLATDEIVNMRIARLAEAPVLLVADIDRGGVFASLVGTLALLHETDRARVRGLIINKLRGDRSLLGSGLDELTARTGLPVLGVVPYLPDIGLPAEDSLDLETHLPESEPDALCLAVVRLPRIANFDDVEPLAREPGVRVRFVTTPGELAAADGIVIPGSKSTVADLAWLRARGLATAIIAAARQGRIVVGLCGGFQMLGARIDDPDHVESSADSADGLGLLPVVTTFERRKVTERVRARVAAPIGALASAAGAELDAYEIHAGRTLPIGQAPHAFEIVLRGGRPADGSDGAIGQGGTVLGTYLHGLFASGPVRRALLTFLASRAGRGVDRRWGSSAPAGAAYDHIADTVGAALDLKTIAGLVGLPSPA